MNLKAINNLLEVEQFCFLAGSGRGPPLSPHSLIQTIKPLYSSSAVQFSFISQIRFASEEPFLDIISSSYKNRCSPKRIKHLSVKSHLQCVKINNSFNEKCI